MSFMLKKIKKKELFENIMGFSFVLPLIIFIIIFILYPVITSIILTLFKWKGYGPIKFVGIQNFVNIFITNEYFPTAVKNSIIFSIFCTSGTILVGFILAVLIDLKVFFWKVYRFIFFLTVILTVIVTGMLWMRVFDPYGLLNNLLTILHLGELQRIWLGAPNTAFAIIIFVTIWQYSGFTMIVFLAGMQNIDETIYEAAKIDGASTMKRIISISIPLLKNVFAIIIALQFIFSFRIFDVIWVMTGGGPAGATEVLGTHLYKLAFQATKFGYASVLAVIMFIISLILSLIYIKISGYQETIKKY